MTLFAFSLWISGIWFILNASIRHNYYCFNAQIVLHLVIGISLKLISVSFWPNTIFFEYLFAFMCSKISLAYPKNPQFLGFIAQIIHKYTHIWTLDNCWSMLSDVWRLSITSLYLCSFLQRKLLASSLGHILDFFIHLHKWM